MVLFSNYWALEEVSKIVFFYLWPKEILQSFTALYAKLNSLIIFKIFRKRILRLNLSLLNFCAFS